VSLPLINRDDCSMNIDDGPSDPQFKYGFCHEGMAGPCCGPAHSYITVMTSREWLCQRGDTVYLFENWRYYGYDVTELVYITYGENGHYYDVNVRIA
jgi:hypothetical protein